MNHKRLFTIFLLLLTLSSCAGKTTEPPPTETPTPEATLVPSPTPTPMPLGSPENPAVIGVVSENENATVSSRSQELAAYLSTETGSSFQSRVFTTYREMLDEMQASRVHAAWLFPLTYLWAHQSGFAQVGLLANHYGVYNYGSQFLVNVSSNFTLYYDPIANRNTADAATALAQFAGKRPCFVEPTSPSGYILPLSLLQENSVDVLEPVWTRSQNAVVRALYIRDICDFGVTFAISGDPRTAESIQQDLPDTMNRILVAWKTDPIIPSMNFSLLPELPRDLVYDILDTLVSLSSSPDGKALLTDATGYDIQGLKRIEDADYDALRHTLEITQLELEPLIGR